MDQLTNLEQSPKATNDAIPVNSMRSEALKVNDTLDIIRSQNAQEKATPCDLPTLDFSLPDAACTVAKAEAAGTVIGGAVGASVGATGGFAIGSFAKALMPKVFSEGVGETTAKLALSGLARGGLWGAAAAGLGVLSYEIVKQSAEHPDRAPDPRFLM